MIDNKVVKRRQRITVVCTNCKKRKSKCDRGNPCSNCTNIKIKNSCVYVKDTATSQMLSAKSGNLPVVIHSEPYNEFINLVPNGN